MENAPAGIAMARPPEAVLDEAKRAARVLADIVSAKSKPVIFNNEQYLEFEDWQTLARFYGVTAKVVRSEYLECRQARGYEARAVAIRADGVELSAADAQCLDDEPNWRGRPMFMLRSMAQTRACAKALRNVLAWVVVLAGYKPTPAEEMVELVTPAAPASRPGSSSVREQLRRALAAWPESERPAVLKAASAFTTAKGEERCIASLDDPKASDKWLYGTLARVKALAQQRRDDVPEAIE